VLDLSEVVAINDDGMAPIFEARETMSLQQGSLRVSSLSPEVAHYLDAVRCDRALAVGSPPHGASPDPAVGSPAGAAEDGAPHTGDDRP
jgi:hypothetical protein